jgi:hypothetical protein
LIDVGDIDSFADAESSGIGLFLSDDHSKERGFAGAVRADDTDDATGREIECKSAEELFVAEGFGEVFGFDDKLSEFAGDGDLDLSGVVAFVVLLGGEFVVALESSFVFGGAGFGDMRTHSSSRLSSFWRRDSRRSSSSRRFCFCSSHEV